MILGMRRFLLLIGLVMITIIVFSGCDKPENPVNPHVIVDFGPVNFNIQIRNENGVDLLDSTKHETYMKDISVKYEGRKYGVGLLPMTRFTRYYMPIFSGLQLERYYSYKQSRLTDSWCLVFGELDGAESVNYDITLQVGDKSVPLTVSSKITMDSEGYPDIDRRYYANGELLTDDAGKRGRYHFLYTSSGDLEYVPSEYE